MAFSSGTATDHDDLWSKLITFLTADAGLVADDQAWTAEWTHADGSASGVVLQGPGLAAQDAVMVGMRLVERPTPDEYEIELVGMTGIISSATGFNEHVNVSPKKVRMFVDSGPMDYWFVANGRRFIVVVKISTVFETLYAGFILPYAMPDQYSYPLFIGGSAGESTDGDLTSWRSSAAGHRHFPHSYYSTVTSPSYEPAAWLISPQGDWLRCAGSGFTDADVAIGPRYFQSGFGISTVLSSTNFGYGEIRVRMRAGFGGEFALTPHTLVQASPSDQTYGILHGTYHVSGFGNASENIVTVDSVDHLVVQDVFRTETGDYWALALE